jgi:hypothetical protein
VIAGPPGTVGTRPYGNAQPMTVSDGFLIPCKHCKRPFVSKGLRCCSSSCERAYCESIEIEKITAEVGMESTDYVKRKCEHCGNPLPRYVGEGKKRKQSTKRFCSSRCQQAAKKQAGITPAKADSQDPTQSVSDPSEVPVPQGVESMVRVPSISSAAVPSAFPVHRWIGHCGG